MSANPSGFVSKNANGRRLPRIRHRADNPPTPDGCRWCGYDQYGHCQRWMPGRGFHGWTAPTDAQRLARMRARRAHRLAGSPMPTQTPGLVVLWSAERRYYEVAHHGSGKVLASGWTTPRPAKLAAARLLDCIDWSQPAPEIQARGLFVSMMRAALIVSGNGGRFVLTHEGRTYSLIPAEAAS